MSAKHNIIHLEFSVNSCHNTSMLSLSTKQTLITLSTILILFFALGFSLYSLTTPDQLFKTQIIGQYLGKLAYLLLFLTLLPGIAKRLSLFPILVRTLMPLRRQLGNAMYIIGLAHWIVIDLTPRLATYTFPYRYLTPTQLAGLILLLTLLPLFLTSNDRSLRLLKKTWSRLHKLVYLGLVFLLLHLIFQASGWSLPLAAFLFLEIISYTKSILARSSSNQ